MRRSARKLELLSMLVMILGVIALCQPWNLFLHSYGATIILVGLILFNIFSRKYLFPNQSTEDAAIGTFGALVHALTTKKSIVLWPI